MCDFLVMRRQPCQGSKPPKTHCRRRRLRGVLRQVRPLRGPLLLGRLSPRREARASPPHGAVATRFASRDRVTPSPARLMAETCRSSLGAEHTGRPAVQEGLRFRRCVRVHALGHRSSGWPRGDAGSRWGGTFVCHRMRQRARRSMHAPRRRTLQWRGGSKGQEAGSGDFQTRVLVHRVPSPHRIRRVAQPGQPPELGVEVLHDGHVRAQLE